MTILYNSIFGIGKMVVFQLVEWICGIWKSLTKVYVKESKDRLAFSVTAIRTRHEITCKSVGREDI